MNDINWREMNDETNTLLSAYPNSKVLVETNITIRVDYAKYIETERFPWHLRTSCEDVIRLAFID